MPSPDVKYTFVLRRGVTEDSANHAVVRALNTVAIVIYTVALIFITTSAWLRRRQRGSRAIGVYYVCSVSVSVGNMLLYAYRLHKEIPVFGGMLWMAVLHSVVFNLFFAGWANSCIWRVFVVCSATIDRQKAAKIFLALKMTAAAQAVLNFVPLLIMVLADNPVYGSEGFLAIAGIACIKDACLMLACNMNLRSSGKRKANGKYLGKVIPATSTIQEESASTWPSAEMAQQGQSA